MHAPCSQQIMTWTAFKSTLPDFSELNVDVEDCASFGGIDGHDLLQFW